MSACELNNVSIGSLSQTVPDPLQTGYEFYHEKYHNFIKHIRKVSSYYSGLKSWYHRLEGVEFDIFIQIVGPEIEDKTPRQIVEKFAKDENFNLDHIKEDDLNKLERYIQLFQVMLEE